MMKHTRLKLFVMVILILAFSLGIDAQTTLTIGDDEVLVYVKWVDGQKTYITRTGDDVFTYVLGDGECTALSPDGKYLASSTEDAETLKIFDFSTMKIIYQQEWNSTWETCYFGWFEENIISFYETNVGSTNFKFENLALTEISTSPPLQSVYPSLPKFYPESKNNFILQNPTNPNIYFYERCLLGYIDQDGFCPANRMVIYNLVTEQDIEIIEDAISDFIRGRDTLSSRRDNHYISAELASWSPDGRYLAYFHNLSRFDTSIPPYEGILAIYDLQSDTYFEDVDRLYNPNINQPFRRLWLDNTTFVLWHTGLFWESTRYNSNEVLFVFVHADTKTYTVTNQPFDVLGTFYPPDGQGGGILFVGKAIDRDYGPQWEDDPKRGDLVYMSSTTGDYTVIDQDVLSIITWRTLEAGETWGE